MILAALNRLYDRLAEQDAVPTFGYSVENISFELIIDGDGRPVELLDLRDPADKNKRAKPMRVPVNYEQPKVGTKISSNPLWDKTAYSLGRSNTEAPRIAGQHTHFKAFQTELFGRCEDQSIQAFLTFIQDWEPQNLEELPGFCDDVLDANIVFRMDGERRYVHEVGEARATWQHSLEIDSESGIAQCLLTGEYEPMSAVHPKIKGVDGAQSSGASIVSFNDTAYLSYGLDKQETAALSKPSVFAYATALNHLLRRSDANYHRLRIGDTTAVFWAEAPDAKAAETAEMLFANMNDPAGDASAPTDDGETRRVHDLLGQIAAGRPLADLDAGLDPETRLYVVGLAPNAARLSIRFWTADRLDDVLARYRWHWHDLALDPPAWRGNAPALWRLINATAPSRDGKTKREDVSPHLAGETMRAVLTGKHYPQALLTNTIMRFRGDGDIGGTSPTGRLRVALVKAVLNRQARLSNNANTASEIPMSLDRDSTHPGYLLGRLFAELENAQRTALGKLNASIKDRYFGSASATPASVFPVLVRNAQHHLANIRKGERPGLAGHIEAEISQIVEGLGDAFPKHLRIQEQGRFAIGYYQQREARFKKSDDGQTPNTPDEATP